MIVFPQLIQTSLSSLFSYFYVTLNDRRMRHGNFPFQTTVDAHRNVTDFSKMSSVRARFVLNFVSSRNDSFFFLLSKIDKHLNWEWTCDFQQGNEKERSIYLETEEGNIALRKSNISARFARETLRASVKRIERAAWSNRGSVIKITLMRGHGEKRKKKGVRVGGGGRWMYT